MTTARQLKHFLAIAERNLRGVMTTGAVSLRSLLGINAIPHLIIFIVVFLIGLLVSCVLVQQPIS